MSLDYYRQTTFTQMPLSFAGYKNMTIDREHDSGMSLKERIQTIIDEMPPPTRGKQVRLAKIAGESKQMVNHWLRDVAKEIQYEPARRICEHFGYRLDWLMRGKGPMRKTDKDEVVSDMDKMALVYLTAEEQQVITHYRATDDIGRAVIRAAAAQSKKS